MHGSARIIPAAWWIVTGALGALGVVSLMTIGVFVLAAAAALTVAGIVIPTLRTREAYLSVCGAAVVPLFMAWQNRDGPGRVCTVSGSAQSCIEAWSPWPFVAVAVVIAAFGLLLYRRA